jgi:hypothetical protein
MIEETLKTLNCEFGHVLHEIRNAKAQCRLPEWSGYWVWDIEKDTIMMHTKEGDVLDIRQTDRVSYTIYNITRKDWILVYPGHMDYDKIIIPMFGYDIARRYLDRGIAITIEGDATYIKKVDGIDYIYSKDNDEMLMSWIPNELTKSIKCFTYHNNYKTMADMNK